MTHPLYDHDELKSLAAEAAAAKSRLAAATRRAAYIASVQDYRFATTSGPRGLYDLFGAKSDLVVIHNMGRGCVYCTTWADGFNGLFDHLSDRAAFVLTSPDSVEVQREFAASRGWRFSVLSTAGTTFARDMGFEKDGKPVPGYSVFARDAGAVTRVGAGVFGPWDDYCALWPMMDQMAGGSGEWKPRYSY